jgi:hypothetical protein
MYPGKGDGAESPLFFREAVMDEDAKDGNGNAYECTLDIGTRGPLVRSRQTDRTFYLSWHDILALALARGIDGTDPIPSPEPKTKKAKAKARAE